VTQESEPAPLQPPAVATIKPDRSAAPGKKALAHPKAIRRELPRTGKRVAQATTAPARTTAVAAPPSVPEPAPTETVVAAAVPEPAAAPAAATPPPAPEVVPPVPTPAPPPPSAAPPPKLAAAPPPKPAITGPGGPGSLDATPAIESLDVKGSLSPAVVRRSVERTLGPLRSCYRTAAKEGKATPAIDLKLSFEIDESSAATRITTSGGSFGSLGSCAASVVGQVRTQEAPDVGTVQVSAVIRFRPTGSTGPTGSGER
jgi:hypothetical protein